MQALFLSAPQRQLQHDAAKNPQPCPAQGKGLPDGQTRQVPPGSGLSLHGKASSFHLILYMPDSRQSPVGFFSD